MSYIIILLVYILFLMRVNLVGKCTQEAIQNIKLDDEDFDTKFVSVNISYSSFLYKVFQLTKWTSKQFYPEVYK